jgi:hypothetical protein
MPGLLLQDKSTLVRNNFIRRLQTLNADYRHLELDYSRLPIIHKRYLHGSATLTDIKEFRALAEAKFNLAAVLQWSPTSHGFDIERCMNSGGPAGSKHQDGVDEGWNELCPLWKEFFTDIHTADHIICGWRDSPHAVPDLDKLESMVAEAETKYTFIAHLLAFVTAQGGHKPEAGFVLQQWMVSQSWNGFCIKIFTAGVNLYDAVKELRSPVATGKDADGFGMVPHEKGFKREYFDFSPGKHFRPWEGFGVQKVAQPDPSLTATGGQRSDTARTAVDMGPRSPTLYEQRMLMVENGLDPRYPPRGEMVINGALRGYSR